MKFILFFPVALMFGSGHAFAKQSCFELQAIYQADLMNSESLRCEGYRPCQNQLASQIRASVRIHAGASASNLAKMPLEVLLELYTPSHKRLYADATAYDVIGLEFNGQIHQTFFFADTSTFSGILTSNGTVIVGGQKCEVRFEPFLNSMHKTAICRELVAVQEPALMALTLPACLLPLSAEEGAGGSVPEQVTKFEVIDFDRKRFQFRAVRHHLESTLICVGTMARKTSAMQEIHCERL